MIYKIKHIILPVHGGCIVFQGKNYRVKVLAEAFPLHSSHQGRQLTIKINHFHLAIENNIFSGDILQLFRSGGQETQVQFGHLEI